MNVFLETKIVTPWATVADLCCDDGEFKAEDQQAAVDWATWMLFKRTGFKYPGVKEVTYRPQSDCSPHRTKFKIPTASNLPIVSIDEIQWDANIVDPDGYRLDGNRFLVHRGYSWPQWPYQNMNLGRGEVGTWFIDMHIGRPVPYGGRWAVRDLAKELLQTCEEAQCGLPKFSGHQENRDGVEYFFMSIDTGWFNIPSVDLFLRENPRRKFSGIGGLTSDMVEETLPESS